jgi:hypothetical protein
VLSAAPISVIDFRLNEILCTAIVRLTTCLSNESDVFKKECLLHHLLLHQLVCSNTLTSMHLNEVLTISTLVVCGVRSAPLVVSTPLRFEKATTLTEILFATQPGIYSNQIVAHEYIEPRPLSSETILVSSINPRPSFNDWTSSSYVDRPRYARSGLIMVPNASAKKGPNITKHVLLEIDVPVKRSKVNDSDKFYTLKVKDLQKGPYYKSDEER